MPNLLITRKSTALLGKEQRAPELVSWSTKSMPGKQWIKEFSFGLQLSFVAAGDEPKMYIHWNQQKFYSFLKSLGDSELFISTNYGICTKYYKGNTIVSLLGAGKTGASLWDSEHNEFSKQHSALDVEDEINWRLGMLKFSLQGPMLFTNIETQEDLEEATALAVIHKKADVETHKIRQTTGQVLTTSEKAVERSDTPSIASIISNFINS